MFEVCKKRNIFTLFFIWYFSEVPRTILKGWRNFLVFYWDYFSIFSLLKTFFSHWKGYIESYGRGFDPGIYLMTFLGNMISRVLGAIIRLVVIIIGLVVECLALVVGLFIFLIWIFSLFIFICGAGIGLYLLL